MRVCLIHTGAVLGTEPAKEAPRGLELTVIEKGPPAEGISGNWESEGAKAPPGPPGGQPFIVSAVLPVVPAKLVKRILGEYVDMAELLWNNMEAERRRQAAGSAGLPRPSRRDMPDIMSWLQYFSLYTAVVCK